MSPVRSHRMLVNVCLTSTLVVLVGALVGGCEPEPDATPEARQPSSEELIQARVDAEEVIERFGRMWEDEDMSAFSRIIANDEDLVVIGTDAAEQIVGYREYERIRRRQFSSFENVEFDVRNRIIKVGADARSAWFAEEFDLLMLVQGSPVSLEGLRLTGGLEKRGDEWVIVQLHTSVPVPGQAAEY